MVSHNVLSSDVDSKGDNPLYINYLANAPSEFTLVHIAVKNGWFKLVNDVMVDRLHFDVNFYKDGNRLTLLHVAAKHCLVPWND